MVIHSVILHFSIHFQPLIHRNDEVVLVKLKFSDGSSLQIQVKDVLQKLNPKILGSSRLNLLAPFYYIVFVFFKHINNLQVLSL